MDSQSEKETSAATTSGVPSQETSDFLHGVRLWIVGFGLCLSLFLPSVEVSIVSTSLVSITDELHGFDQSTWVITSYLLTYTGFLMIWSKCGDIFGVKPSLLCSLAFFIAFSGGCGGAQSLNQLIICRAFQGVGAAGVYTLTLFSLLRLVPHNNYDMIASVAAGVMAIGLVLGPLIGGAINVSGDWRWIFLLNLPAGAVAWLMLLMAMPPHYPYHSPARSEAEGPSRNTLNTLIANQKTFFRRVDFFGAFLVLAASMFIIAALQEGNLDYGWSSALIIAFIVVSSVLWLSFLGWEWLVSHRLGSKIQPMLPWRLTRNRVFLGVALGFLLTGAPLTICVIELPQRYQTVNNSSPISAGVNLLSYALAQPVGSLLCSSLSGRLKIPFIWIILTGIILQIVGLFLLSTVPADFALWTGQFGYTVLAGLGVGMAVTAVYIMVPLVVDEEDQAIALGTGLQLRMLGGALGVAIATAILNSRLKSDLGSLLSQSELDEVLDSAQAINSLRPSVQDTVRKVFAGAYNQQMKAAGGFSVAQLLVVGLIWKRKQVRFVKDAAVVEE
ncbi:major facilitator superfamily domain-containing protein [Aspergillus venezuelensis]